MPFLDPKIGTNIDTFSDPCKTSFFCPTLRCNVYISGVFRQFTPDDFIDLLLSNNYREVYYDMNSLEEKHWTRLKSTASNLLGIIAKYNPTLSKNL